MARQTGILELSGSLGGLSFYNTSDGKIMRKGWGPDKVRMRRDPSFAQARQNGKEFGAAARAGKRLRSAINLFLKDASDKRAYTRVTKLMFDLKNLDLSSKAGSRKVSVGILEPQAKTLLNRFSFNVDVKLDELLLVPLKTDALKGTLSIPEFKAAQDLAFPKAATHVCFNGGMARVDFESGNYEVKTAEEISLSRKAPKQDLIFTMKAKFKITGRTFFVLKITFFQEVNGKQYPLKDMKHNASFLLL